jgi:hypothetical protein
MSLHATFYVQQCPTCGRQLRICVEYLGKSIQCRHCRAVFMACDPAVTPDCSADQDHLLQRVDELLALSETTH